MPGAKKVKLAPEQRLKVVTWLRARRTAAAATRAADKLKDEILSIVKLAGGRIVALNAIAFIGQSVSYEYPEALKQELVALGKKTKIAQLDGSAQKISKDCLQFSDLKKKEPPKQ